MILSLFPGIGLLDMAFEEQGWCVVRGPDVLWGGDIRRFNPPAGHFEGVIGGPPCQEFSTLANLVRARGYEPRFGNLIPEFERCVGEAEPHWFLMENVRAAPSAKVAGYAVHEFLLDNVWLGEEQRRKRRFSFGVRGDTPVDLRRWIEVAALELPIARHCVLSDQRAVPVKIGGSGKVKAQVATIRDGGVRVSIENACRLQGLPDDFLAEAPFTKQGKLKAFANGVPLPMGRAVAKAIVRWKETQ